MKKIKIAIISDIICPWCYIGKSRLFRAIDKSGGKYDIITIMRSYQLYPNIPKGGLAKDKFASIKKPGMGSALKKAAEEEQLIFNFKNISRIPNTLEAHRLMYLCKDNQKKNKLNMALFVSYFEKGEDVEDLNILIRIAKECEISNTVIKQFLTSKDGIAEIQTEILALKEEGVTVVPSFILNGKHLIMGEQSVDNWLKYFKRVKS